LSYFVKGGFLFSKEIYAIMAQRICDGLYPPGHRLPPVRQVAQEFGCNKLTVHKAYEQLKRDGLLYTIVGRGSFVSKELLLPQKNRGFFQSAYLHHSFFPYEPFSEILRDLFRQSRAFSLQQPPLPGDPALIDVLSRLYRLPSERLLIVSGAQQGLDITRTVLDIRDPSRILFEDPSYPGAAALFMPGSFVPMGASGPDPGLVKARAALQGVRLFYTIPAVHNPTGFSYSLEIKQKICRLASDLDFYLIEDDSLSEYFPSESPRFLDLLPQRTFFIKSLAKSTVSGIRLGMLVPPAPFFSSIITAKYLTDISTSGLLQHAMSRFFQEGFFAPFKEHILTVHSARKNTLLNEISSQTGLAVSGGDKGFWLWVKRTRESIEAPYLWTEGRTFSPAPEYRSYFRLAYMDMDDQAFAEGLSLLQSDSQTLSR